MPTDGRQIQDSLRSLAGAKSSLEQLHGSLVSEICGDDVRPSELPRDIAECLNAVLSGIEVAERNLQAQFESNAAFLFAVLSKLQMGAPLSKAEYYKLRADDLIQGVDEEHSEYERYMRAVVSK